MVHRADQLKENELSALLASREVFVLQQHHFGGQLMLPVRDSVNSGVRNVCAGFKRIGLPSNRASKKKRAFARGGHQYLP